MFAMKTNELVYVFRNNRLIESLLLKIVNAFRYSIAFFHLLLDTRANEIYEMKLFAHSVESCFDVGHRCSSKNVSYRNL